MAASAAAAAVSHRCTRRTVGLLIMVDDATRGRTRQLFVTDAGGDARVFSGLLHARRGCGMFCAPSLLVPNDDEGGRLRVSE